MEQEIRIVRDLIELRRERTNEEQAKIANMILRFARFLPSPSKLNALSVLKTESNTDSKLAAWLSQEEGIYSA